MTARSEDILVAYNPGVVEVGTQAGLLEVRSEFPEMRGGADTHYEDFTSGLREFVETRMAARVADGGMADVFSPDWLASPCPCSSAPPAGIAGFVVDRAVSGPAPAAPRNEPSLASPCPCSSAPPAGSIAGFVVDRAVSGSGPAAPRNELSLAGHIVNKLAAGASRDEAGPAAITSLIVDKGAAI